MTQCQGRLVERIFSTDECATLADTFAAFGVGTFDVYLNGGPFWRNVPAAVWNYRFGGYQVLKKWLSYRERDILGPPLRPEEVQHFTDMARWIGAIMSMTTSFSSPQTESQFEQEKKMTSANQNQINRLTKEIADLRTNDAREARKESDLMAKINRANEAASRTRNSSTFQNKAREAERAMKDLANVQKKRADISKKISDKSRSLNSYQGRYSQEMQRESKRRSDQEKRLIREREQYERKITKEIRSRAALQSTPLESRQQAPEQRDSYDFFISHASEDKSSFVRALAETLQAKGAKVWYDEFTLKVGDSLRQKIDQGLLESRYGIVVISRNFIARKWPQRELDGLVNLEVDGRSRILPIWHEISKDEVTQYSPTLADKVALNTSILGIEDIASELVQLVGLGG